MAIRIDRKLNSTDVIDALSDLFILSCVPGYVRSDKGPDFIAKVVREWIVAVGAKIAFIEPDNNRRGKRLSCAAIMFGRLKDQHCIASVLFSLSVLNLCPIPS